jgi:hypothetical protein
MCRVGQKGEAIVKKGADKLDCKDRSAETQGDRQRSRAGAGSVIMMAVTMIVVMVMIVGMIMVVMMAVRCAHARALEEVGHKKKKPRAPRGNSARGFKP